jgi:carbon monoxide dehydrogenase subunit G
MRFEGEFQVPGAPAQVIEAFADVDRMVQCMPGASLEGQDAEGNHLGSMVVAFGPKKIKFKGKVRNEVDRAALRGTLDVRGAAEMRMTAPAQVHVSYSVQPAGASNASSRVALTSDAELGGVLADFARTGGIAVTQALMEVFAERLAAELEASLASRATAASTEAPATTAAPEETIESAPVAASPSPPTAALSARGLAWRVLKAKLRGFMRRIRREGYS